jgi:hypothetical protein
LERSRVTELHYMTPLSNLASIAEHGLLSHQRVAQLPHASVAMAEVQDRRSVRTVPGGRPLHEYVNLYFDARNAMMRLRRAPDLVVVRLSDGVLDLDGAVVADGNAANGPTRFYPSPGGLAHLDADRVFAEWWTIGDEFERAERKRQRQAEVLVPDVVPPEYIVGCYTWPLSVNLG